MFVSAGGSKHTCVSYFTCGSVLFQKLHLIKSSTTLYLFLSHKICVIDQISNESNPIINVGAVIEVSAKEE